MALTARRTCWCSGQIRWRSFRLWCCIVAACMCTTCAPDVECPSCVLRFVTWKPGQPAVWDEIIALFEAEHPGMRVVREIGPHSSTAFHDMLTQKLKNKSSDTDIFFMDVIWPPEFAAAGWAEPLDRFFPEPDRNEFIQGALLANTWEGSLYGVPLFIDSGMFYYRADLLARYGLNPPVTWPEMVRQAHLIVAREARQGRHLFGFSGQFKQYEGLVCNMLEYILGNQGAIIDQQEGRPAIDSPAALAAVAFVRDEIIGRVAPRGVLTYEEPESLALFIQGRTVFHRNWPYAWEVANDPKRSRIAGSVGIAALPHFSGGTSCAALGGWQLGMSRYSRNKKAAWAFIRFLTSSRVQKLLALGAGLAPTRASLYDDADIIRKYPQFAAMRAVFLGAQPRPRSPLYPGLSHVLQRYFSRVLADPGADLRAEALSASAGIGKILQLAREE
ncbi:MAG: ABC transporter substrate-binding protein [Deltaproteobacteria bacterium]|nr:ABC transporter substrate-binding protein [Deltaproteobacteria bacterium]